MFTRQLNFNLPAERWAARHGKPMVGNGDVHRLRQLGSSLAGRRAARGRRHLPRDCRRPRPGRQPAAVLDRSRRYHVWISSDGEGTLDRSRTRRRPQTRQVSRCRRASRLAREAPRPRSSAARSSSTIAKRRPRMRRRASPPATSCRCGWIGPAPPGARTTRLGDDRDLPIVYEDDALIVLNKPAGVLAVPPRARARARARCSRISKPISRHAASRDPRSSIGSIATRRASVVFAKAAAAQARAQGSVQASPRRAHLSAPSSTASRRRRPAHGAIDWCGTRRR